VGRWKKVGVLRGDIGTVKLALTPTFIKLDHHPQKLTVQPGDPFEDTSFKPGFEIVKILNQLVDSQLFTFFVNKYHQWPS
jgi:hypothetical protein